MTNSLMQLLGTFAQESHVPADGVERSRSGAMGTPLHLRPAAIVAPWPGEVTDDVEAGLAEYARLRESWDALLVRLAGLLGYTPEQIDVSM
jgi:hypothetical protein